MEEEAESRCVCEFEMLYDDGLDYLIAVVWGRKTIIVLFWNVQDEFRAFGRYAYRCNQLNWNLPFDYIILVEKANHFECHPPWVQVVYPLRSY